MIEFHYETEFRLKREAELADWVGRVIVSEGSIIDKIDYIFCDDDYLLKLNKQYLNHDTFTDIITFDYSIEGQVSGDIFISTERVEDNARTYNQKPQIELLRVMSHGLLHLLGYDDKSETDKSVMRIKEAEKIELFHVEH